MTKVLSVIFAVPPSSPLCSQSGQTSVGSSAALRCSSSEGAPRPVYHWVRLGSSPTPSPGSMVQGKGPSRKRGCWTWANLVSRLHTPTGPVPCLGRDEANHGTFSLLLPGLSLLCHLSVLLQSVAAWS